MKDFIIHDNWKIIERNWNPENRQVSESIFSVGNGYMGVRGNFSEKYSGESLSGSYLAGIYYPDKTRVGWWKNGYPEYFAKVPNSVQWIGITLKIDDVDIDLNTVEVLEHELVLNMKTGILHRKTKINIPDKGEMSLESERFCSMAQKEKAMLKYKVTSHSVNGRITIGGQLDFNVMNSDANYDENFWSLKGEGQLDHVLWVSASTHKTNFTVMAAMNCDISMNGRPLQTSNSISKGSVLQSCDQAISSGDEIEIIKEVVITQSMYVATEKMPSFVCTELSDTPIKTFETAKKAHVHCWSEKWDQSDIKIEGDTSAQQGIRYNIFQLNQTYTGEDSRLNVGPKGLTGEKYGGSTYWDTEAYCLPFYLSTAEPEVSRNLLVYRYNHLQKAIENAEKLGFTAGAALYPMVTMNGEECHNEWEITFEEIHRNGAIAFAIYNYINYTGDDDYLVSHGLEVLVAIARFWAQRINFSEEKNAYVMLGVTGPNEYENNVNNNWYTNYLAVWCMKYAEEALNIVKEKDEDAYSKILDRISFSTSEIEEWNTITYNMYYPYDSSRNIFLQQDGFLDKIISPVDNLEPSEQPICQNWSWDRILRSCYIKQADVLQGLYFFEDQFDRDTIERNFNFYEPLTVHESSLSPCIHSILAASIDNLDKAYEMYLRTARLDLDDYNNDTEDGLHITSMAGTWLALVEGFGGMRIKKGQLHFRPQLSSNWEAIEFKILFRKNKIGLRISKNGITLKNLSGPKIEVFVFDQPQNLSTHEEKRLSGSVSSQVA